MISLQCRLLVPSDLPAALQLDHDCFAGLWTAAGYQRELTSPNSDLLGLFLQEGAAGLATHPPRLVGIGCAWAILEEAHITLLGIAPAYRRRGLGQWLLLQLLSAARDRGLTHATLEVRPSNHAARCLYQSFGFQVAGERRHYYDDGENALILWRGGLQAPAWEASWGDRACALCQRFCQQGWQPSPSLSSPVRQ